MVSLCCYRPSYLFLLYQLIYQNRAAFTFNDNTISLHRYCRLGAIHLLEEWYASITAPTMMWFIASVVIATSLRFILQLIGKKNTTAANAAIIMILEPVMTVFVAAIWYHERMPLIQIVGCILILCALFYYRWRCSNSLPK